MGIQWHFYEMEQVLESVIKFNKGVYFPTVTGYMSQLAHSELNPKAFYYQKEKAKFNNLTKVSKWKLIVDDYFLNVIYYIEIDKF